ncbi:hypothetical protein JCM10213_000766 [Rhodosporidiobolus nylandii]
MDMISHKTQQAKRHLERAIDLGSSAACATLANLLSRNRSESTSSPTPSPPLASASSPIEPIRPSLLPRQASNAYAHHGFSYRKTWESLRATELFIRGLEIELKKPVQGEGGEGQVESEYESAGEEEYGAEGRWFALDRALDLVVGVTDAHRFGIVRAPSASSGHQGENGDGMEDPNDLLWTHSSAVATSLLSHPTIAPLVASAKTRDLSPSPARPLMKHRPSSVSRSYTHAASSIPSSPISSASQSAPIIPLSPRMKVQLTVAIHALYLLALQAHSSSPSFSSSADASTSDAEKHWSTIVRLVAPFAAQGGIGIKEGDELAARAQHRLDSFRREDLGEHEPWRLAKQQKRRGRTSEPAAATAIEAGAITIRPDAQSGSAGSSDGQTPKVGGSSARIHLASRAADEVGAAEEDVAEPVAAGESGFTLSPPADLLVSPPRRGGSKPVIAPVEASQEYPSPPQTPPLEQANLWPQSSLPVPPPPRPAGDRSRESTLSNLSPVEASTAPTSGAPSPLSPSTTSLLPRAPSTRSFASYRSAGGASVLSSFSVNPLQAYLSRRGLRSVESSTSVCTAPPDFEREGARRWSRRDKGKGRAVDVPGDEQGPTKAARQPKTWLSRFWGATKGGETDATVAAVDEGGDTALERTHSSSAVDELRRALERHDEAREGMMSYWGETEFVEDDELFHEEDGGEVLEPAPAFDSPSASPPSPVRGLSEATLRPTPSSSAAPRTAAPPVASPPQPSTPLRPPPLSLDDQATPLSPPMKSAKSKRSFLLGDPTSAPASRRTSRDRSSSRRHKPNLSVSSTSTAHSTTIDGHLAPPSPKKAKGPVPIDPLLLELERRSHVGVRTVCATCGKKGLNYPACRTCKGTYCRRECRVNVRHPCSAAAKEARVVAA